MQSIAYFPEAIVITLECAKSEVSCLSKKYDLDMVLDVVTIPTLSTSGSISSQGEEFGTADAIRHIHDKLKANRVIVVSCDLVTDFQVYTTLIWDLTSIALLVYKNRSIFTNY